MTTGENADRPVRAVQLADMYWIFAAARTRETCLLQSSYLLHDVPIYLEFNLNQYEESQFAERDSMTTVRFPNYIAVVLAASSLGATASATAQLGTAARSADASQGEVMHRAQPGGVEYREMTDASGIVVREYVDADDTVYAVSWRGPAMPDVEALLGTYFEPFREAAHASAGALGLHAARVTRGDLVVENHVRLREFSGRAWLASGLPAGVNASDIQ
jgi:hypothetical protein